MAQSVNIEIADRASARDDVQSISRSTSNRRDGICILLVEDDATQRELLALVLERAGAVVMEASCAPEALERLERSATDVVLSDISMPGGDGFSFIRELRSSDRADIRSLPVVAVTAFAMAQDRKCILQAGFDRHVAKPAVPADLVALVRTLALCSPNATTRACA